MTVAQQVVLWMHFRIEVSGNLCVQCPVPEQCPPLGLGCKTSDPCSEHYLLAVLLSVPAPRADIQPVIVFG